MSHTTKFTVPGWGACVLIHDGFDMEGKVTLRAWYPGHLPDRATNMDYLAEIGVNGEIDVLVSSSHPTNPSASHGLEDHLLLAAGMAIGRRRLEAEITKVLEDHGA